MLELEIADAVMTGMVAETTGMATRVVDNSSSVAGAGALIRIDTFDSC